MVVGKATDYAMASASSLESELGFGAAEGSQVTELSI
jgi:hypothetical protein